MKWSSFVVKCCYIVVIHIFSTKIAFRAPFPSPSWNILIFFFALVESWSWSVAVHQSHWIYSQWNYSYFVCECFWLEMAFFCYFQSFRFISFRFILLILFLFDDSINFYRTEKQQKKQQNIIRKQFGMPQSHKQISLMPKYVLMTNQQRRRKYNFRFFFLLYTENIYVNAFIKRIEKLYFSFSFACTFLVVNTRMVRYSSHFVGQMSKTIFKYWAQHFDLKIPRQFSNLLSSKQLSNLSWHPFAVAKWEI